MFDANGKLTRAGAEQAIREGGSVWIGGKAYNRIETLPGEVEFAIGDPTQTQKVLDGIAAQRKALDDQEQRVHASNAQNEQARKDAEKAQKEREQREAADRKAKDQADRQQGERQPRDAAAEKEDPRRGK